MCIHSFTYSQLTTVELEHLQVPQFNDFNNTVHLIPDECSEMKTNLCNEILNLLYRTYFLQVAKSLK